nr:hypothetical protein K-LCC10_0252 [Kaumoebavirus]
MDRACFELLCHIVPREIATEIEDHLIATYRRENARKCAEISRGINYKLFSYGSETRFNDQVFKVEIRGDNLFHSWHTKKNLISYTVETAGRPIDPEIMISYGCMAKIEFRRVGE